MWSVCQYGLVSPNKPDTAFAGHQSNYLDWGSSLDTISTIFQLVVASPSPQQHNRRKDVLQFSQYTHFICVGIAVKPSTHAGSGIDWCVYLHTASLVSSSWELHDQWGQAVFTLRFDSCLFWVQSSRVKLRFWIFFSLFLCRLLWFSSSSSWNWSDGWSERSSGSGQDPYLHPYHQAPWQPFPLRV